METSTATTITNNSFKQFVCLSGLPRSGSTLLSAILSQNPAIHAEGNSAVCQLMWDMQTSCLTASSQQLAANNRSSTINDLIAQIPHIYYKNKNMNEQIIVDKCRSWTIEANINLLKKYMNHPVKIIVLERKVIDVVKSFAKLYRANGRNNTELENSLVNPKSEPIMRSLEGIQWAKNNNQDNTFLFVKYDDLINNTKETIRNIYNFCGWEHFKHDFNNIISKYPENDEVYNLKGQHKIRSKVKQHKNETILNDVLEKKCNIIDNLYS